MASGSADDAAPANVREALRATDAGYVERVMQLVRLELYRDNFQGALDLLETAQEMVPDPRCRAQAAQIRSWLEPLQRHETYAVAYERYYRSVKRRHGLKWLDWEFRVRTGRKTRRMVERCSQHPEFRLLEREVAAVGARRVLDAGCGEGRIALTLAARHPDLAVEGIEVSATNVRIARRLNRFPNVTFHEILIEEASPLFRLESFDIAYAFGVLEHVWDLDETVTAMLKLLRPGGRLCLVVPMNEFRAVGPLPEFTPEDAACHVRVFTDTGLRERFGGYPGYTLTKCPGEWRSGRYPEGIRPVEFGSFFAAFSKP